MSTKTVVNSIWGAFGLYLLLGALLVFPAGFLYLDFAVLGLGIPESSVTEVMQSILIALTMLGFLWVAVHSATERGFAILGAGLFAAILIREQNNFMLSGYWEVLVVITAVIASVLAYRLGGGLVRQRLFAFMCSPAGAVMGTGLMLLLVYAQTIGMGEVWHAVLGHDFQRVVKRTTEEANETMSYVVIFYAGLIYWWKNTFAS